MNMKNEVLEKDKYDFNILHHAIQNTAWGHDPCVVEKLIETRKFKITEIDKRGNTSLHLAAQCDKQENHKILSLFIRNPSIPKEDFDACMERRNYLGLTPLHIACSVGNHESVMMLWQEGRKRKIDVKSIINSPDKNGCFPLDLAITSNNLDMVDVLTNIGVKVTEDTMSAAARLVL